MENLRFLARRWESVLKKKTMVAENIFWTVVNTLLVLFYQLWELRGGEVLTKDTSKKKEKMKCGTPRIVRQSICLYSHSISWMLLSVLIISLLRSLASVLTSTWRWHHLCSSVCKCVCVCVCICHLWKKLLALTPSALVNHLSSPLSLLSLLPPSTETCLPSCVCSDS